MADSAVHTAIAGGQVQGVAGAGAVHIENFTIHNCGTRAPIAVPSEQAPADYVDRPELTGDLLAYLLNDEPSPRGRAVISAVHGLGGMGKTTTARWLVWQPEVERRFPDGRLWVTLGNDAPDALTLINDLASQLDPAFRAKATRDTARAGLATLLQDRSVLLVIDDVWPGRSLDAAKALLVPAPRSRFLLTTRFPQLASDPGIRAVNFQLGEMGDAQASALISYTLGRSLALAELPFARRLRATVGGHPFALELAAARIRGGRDWGALLGDLTAETARLDALEETDDNLLSETVLAGASNKLRSVRASLMLVSIGVESWLIRNLGAGHCHAARTRHALSRSSFARP